MSTTTSTPEPSASEPSVLERITFGDPETRSADLVAGNIERLRELFPEAFTEDGIDFDTLRQLLGGAVVEREEKYGLGWHGKRQARQIALTPSTGTLLPRPEESVDWDTTQNLIIEGDNLEVLKLLQKSYAGKVKLIYIDPPYNTGKDFVYRDDYRDNMRNYLAQTGQVDGEGQRTSSNTEASGRFHTDWLNMMYPRLMLAKNLLLPSGVIFISIDDGESASLRQLADEIFGEEALICQFTWVKKRKGSHLSDTHRSMTEYVLAYARDKEGLVLFGEGAYSDKLQPLAKKTNALKILSFPAHTVRTQLAGGRHAEGIRGDGDSSLKFHNPIVVVDGLVVSEMSVEGPFVWTQRKLDEELQLGSVVHLSSKFGFNVGRHDQAEKFKAPSTLLSGVGTNEDAFEELARLFGVERVFDFTKPVSLIKYLINTVSFASRSGIVLDFFAGSGTTAHAVVAQNAADGGDRRYVLVQLPEQLDSDKKEQAVAAAYCDDLGIPRRITELTKERIRRAGAKLRDENPLFQGDLGFRVFKLAPSNIRAWEPSHHDVEQSLLDHIEHILPGRTEQDVLYELLLKLGLDLTVPIEQRTIAGKTVHSVGGGVLLVCLAESVAREEVERLALGIVAWYEELAPAGEAQVVVRDAAFADDVARTNLAAILVQHGLERVRSL